MRSVILFTALFAACTPATDAVSEVDPFDGDTARVDEATPEAFGVLALLNDAGTTEALLDVDAALDARAARSLVHHRNGPDGVFGTSDDNLFDDIAEADAQYYVGASALDKLAAFAATAGLVPSGDDVVGVWEGTPFTMNEVTWTLEFANTADQVELDDDVGLDSRAAQGIVDARPIATMNDLATAYYVGGSAMADLRDYASAATLGGAWDTCDTSDDCQAGLVCMGELAYGNGIYCVDDSMYGTFSSSDGASIDDDGSTLSSTVTVSGLATVPVDVVLTLDIDHPRPSDLVVTIDNFNGYSETVWNNETNPASEIIVRAFPSDDMVNGDYSIHITDTVTGEAGTLVGWDLYIVSNWD
jgi:hypothetical protein